MLENQNFTAIDIDDDILDDDDDELFSSTTELEEAPSKPRSPKDRDTSSLTDPKQEELPPGAVMGPFGPRFLSLEEAVSEHNAEGIKAAAANGEKIPKHVDPLVLVAKGTCPEALDHQYHQSAQSVAAALGALREIGVDLNQDHESRGGMPAAHILTAHYGGSMIYNHFDKSEKAANGMTDQKHGERLAEFARAGVDFTTVDKEGRRPLTMLKDFAIEAAERKGVNPKPVMDYVDHEYQQVKRAARQFRVHDSASTEAKRQAEVKAARKQNSGPAIGD
jgi:hypothetical protein